MELSQRRLFEKTKFLFKDDGFDYTVKDRSGTASFFTKYLDLNFSAQSQLIQRNEYFRNLGFIWVALGLISLAIGGGSLNGGFWFILGAICLGVYYFAATEFIVIPAATRTIYVIKNGTESAVLEKLMDGFKRKILEEHGEVNYERTFEDEKAKFKYLLEQGLLTEAEFSDRLRKMEDEKEKFVSPSK